jgi:hypothetical protein|eukprot:COSAG01_NODE_2823_length_7006_cov_12.699146_9_plen_44_part_00
MRSLVPQTGASPSPSVLEAFLRADYVAFYEFSDQLGYRKMDGV